MFHSQSRKSRRSAIVRLAIALAASITFVYACSSNDSSITQPPPTPVLVCGADTASFNRIADGTYLVSQFDGKDLPTTERGAGGQTRQVDWAMATLSGGHYSIAIGQYFWGRDSTNTADVGSYTQCGSTLQLHSSVHSGVVYPGTSNAGSFSVEIPAAYAGVVGLDIAIDFETRPCGSVADSAVHLSGTYDLATVSGATLPDTLPITYPYTVVLLSAKATLRSDDTYLLEGLSEGSHGATDAGGQSGALAPPPVTALADSGTIERCGSRIRFQSALYRGYIYGTASGSSLVIHFPADQIHFYDFYGFGDYNDKFDLNFSLED